jgi:tRNA pseudouridine38-40 synthase
MKIAIKFGYLGWDFSGFQAGNGQNSIEDAISACLEKIGTSTEIHSAARTDRGVSALSNVFTVETDLSAQRILGSLNSMVDSMVFHSWSPVAQSFNPRHCENKTYRYMLQQEEMPNRELILPQIRMFLGTHDFSAFSRRDGRNPVRTIDSIELLEERGMLFIDFTARSFLWNQIRSIIAFVVESNASGEIRDPFSSTERFPRIAPAAPLILMDVRYPDVTFSPLMGRSKLAAFSRKLREIHFRGCVSQQLMNGITGINSNMRK